jgi:hypothetical protein
MEIRHDDGSTRVRKAHRIGATDAVTSPAGTGDDGHFAGETELIE